MWSCYAECLLLEFLHLFFRVFNIFDAGLHLLDRLVIRTNWKTFTCLFWLWRSVAPYNYLLFSTSRDADSLWKKQYVLWHRQMHRQSAGKRRGSTLMEERWEQSWWEIGTFMLPAALSCHSLACPAVLAQAEVQRLNHRGWSGQPGHLIFLFDHRSALGERYCVPSLFIKIGLNGLFLCLGARGEKERQGRYKRPLEATDKRWAPPPFTCTTSSKRKFFLSLIKKKSSFWLELAWLILKQNVAPWLTVDVLITSDSRFLLKQEQRFIPHLTNKN